LNQRARYRGTIKNQFQALMPAFAHNLKRLIKIEIDPIPLVEV
jgi:IS5 family transposase